jgi:hypothetical protein
LDSFVSALETRPQPQWDVAPVIAWLEAGGLASNREPPYFEPPALPGEGDSIGAEYRRATAAVFAGFRMLRNGDSTRARASLAQAFGVNRDLGANWYPVRGRGSLLDPVQWGMLALARLDRAAGQTEQAKSRLDYGVFTTVVVSARAEMEELRGLIAAERGDTAPASRSLRSFVELWRDADPQFQPRVAAARALLAALDRRPGSE